MSRIALSIAGPDYDSLHGHLFQPDRDEHAALILAGRRERGQDVTLLAREIHLLAPADFTPGARGYRQVSAAALARFGREAARKKLALITCHSHPRATTKVRLSRGDLAGHRRVFPHLLDILDGQPAAGIAFGSDCAAGEFWCRSAGRLELATVDVVGPRIRRLAPMPSPATAVAARFNRQARMFGAAGQALLRRATVGVVGVGGGGSIVVEQLAHLGVGRIVAVDYDTVEPHNLSRIVGAREADAARSRKKVEVACRLVRAIDPQIAVEAVDGDITDPGVAERMAHCDFLFLCTDTITSRLVANAIVHSHHVPMIQVGAKVDMRSDGGMESVYAAVRPVFPKQGCLACASLLDPVALQREAATDDERRAQNYLGLDDAVEPSVITLNGVGASVATTTFLMALTGLGEEWMLRHRLFDARTGRWLELQPRRRSECRWCGEGPQSQAGLGDAATLPLRLSPV